MVTVWENLSGEERKKLDALVEIPALIRAKLAVYLKTPIATADRHVFSEEIRRLAHELENWVDDYEVRIK